MNGPFLVAYFINNDDASIEIEGLGTFNFTIATRFFSNVENGLVGFSRAGVLGTDLFNGPNAGGWDMTSSIGPLTGPGKIWWDGGVFTDGGELLFFTDDSRAAFTAVVGPVQVPEPASLLLLGAGVAMAVRRRARRV
jgi:hypothetical protein